jgi:hypothetical protein
MIFHQPPFDDVSSPHPFFLMPKVKGVKVTKHTWFMNTHVGRNIIGKLSNFTNDIPTLKGNELLIRLGKALWFQEWKNLLPVEYGPMKILNHHNAKSYGFFLFYVFLFKKKYCSFVPFYSYLFYICLLFLLFIYVCIQCVVFPSSFGFCHFLLFFLFSIMMFIFSMCFFYISFFSINNGFLWLLCKGCNKKKLNKNIHCTSLICSKNIIFVCKCLHHNLLGVHNINIYGT